MNLRVWENPWRLMLAVNAAVLVGVFLHKITLPPYVPYIHLLVDYHFGFTKRALIGAIVSLFTAKVPVWLVFALGGAAWLVTAGLFVQLFRRTFGFEKQHLPLFVFMAGSPFFLKNFMHTLGHFDIYGCLLSICLLLIPARSVAYVLLAALFSATLVLIHHIHLLMYVPTIAVIVVLRHYLDSGMSRRNVAVGIASLIGLGGLFVAAQFYGTVPVSEAEFVAHLRSRMADSSQANLLSFGYIWYQPLAKEISDTWQRLPHNLLGVPVFALLIWLHAPLWRYLRDLIAALSVDAHRHVVTTAIAIVSLGYLVMFAIVFDYSRWVSNWAVCLMLILHAVRALPSAKDAALITADDRKTVAFGWIVTLIPRVGIVRPF
jgi:ABC-type tungstate transport system substrate-binding protein